jgi:hypothetical protein
MAPVLFTLSPTPTSTTGLYAPTLGRNSATTTREAAEQVAQAIAHACEAELVVHLPDGKTSRTRLAKSWAARLIRRNRATPCYTFMPSTCSRVHASS